MNPFELIARLAGTPWAAWAFHVERGMQQRFPDRLDVAPEDFLRHSTNSGMRTVSRRVASLMGAPESANSVVWVAYESSLWTTALYIHVVEGMLRTRQIWTSQNGGERLPTGEELLASWKDNILGPCWGSRPHHFALSPNTGGVAERDPASPISRSDVDNGLHNHPPLMPTAGWARGNRLRRWVDAVARPMMNYGLRERLNAVVAGGLWTLHHAGVECLDHLSFLADRVVNSAQGGLHPLGGLAPMRADMASAIRSLPVRVNLSDGVGAQLAEAFGQSDTTYASHAPGHIVWTLRRTYSRGASPHYMDAFRSVDYLQGAVGSPNALRLPITGAAPAAIVTANEEGVVVAPGLSRPTFGGGGGGDGSGRAAYVRPMASCVRAWGRAEVRQAPTEVGILLTPDDYGARRLVGYPLQLMPPMSESPLRWDPLHGAADTQLLGRGQATYLGASVVVSRPTMDGRVGEWTRFEGDGGHFWALEQSHASAARGWVAAAAATATAIAEFGGRPSPYHSPLVLSYVERDANGQLTPLWEEGTAGPITRVLTRAPWRAEEPTRAPLPDLLRSLGEDDDEDEADADEDDDDGGDPADELLNASSFAQVPTNYRGTLRWTNIHPTDGVPAPDTGPYPTPIRSYPTLRRQVDSDRTRVRLLGSTIHHYHGHGRPAILVRRPSTRQRRENRGLEEYTIGFEVEKDCAINKNGSVAYGPGDLVDVTPLFAYWERDGSCGVEGVTHAYALDNYPLFKKHVMKSEWLLRSPCAGLRDRRDQDESRFGNPRRYSCGGHLTLAGPEERVTMPRIRNYSGLIYALYRPRLRNGFCDDNKDLASDGTRTHYAAIRSRGPGMIEFRIVRRVLSPHHLLWRFRLFRKVALAVKQDMPFGDFLRSVRPLLDEVYQLEDRREVESYAKKFDDYLTRGWVHEDIIPYI